MLLRRGERFREWSPCLAFFFAGSAYRRRDVDSHDVRNARASCWDFRVARLAAAYNRQYFFLKRARGHLGRVMPKLYLSVVALAWLARRAGPRIGPSRASVSVKAASERTVGRVCSLATLSMGKAQLTAR